MLEGQTLKHLVGGKPMDLDLLLEVGIHITDACQDTVVIDGNSFGRGWRCVSPDCGWSCN